MKIEFKEMASDRLMIFFHGVIDKMKELRKEGEKNNIGAHAAMIGSSTPREEFLTWAANTYDLMQETKRAALADTAKEDTK
jgi:hypothetical protein